MISSDLHNKIEYVKNLFHDKIVIVAFSGGVDSAVVGKLAQLYSQQAFLVTGDSLTVPPGELKIAKEVAEEIGLVHLVIKTNEMQNREYIENPINRCYYCKTELSKILIKVANDKHADLIVEGTNYSDIISNDHRPGYEAIKENDILSPLVEAKITKKEIRKLALEWNLSISNKPSMACLSSRFPYGDKITASRLNRISQAENYLKNKLNIEILRVRDHNGIARIEVAPLERSKFYDNQILDKVYQKLHSLGFSYVTLDLKGYRSGSLNEILL